MPNQGTSMNKAEENTHSETEEALASRGKKKSQRKGRLQRRINQLIREKEEAIALHPLGLFSSTAP